MKEWKVKDEKDFIRQLKGFNVSNINIRCSLLAEVESILRSGRKDNPIETLGKGKRFIAMEEKERKDGVIGRIKNLNWPKSRLLARLCDDIDRTNISSQVKFIQNTACAIITPQSEGWFLRWAEAP